MNVLEDVPKSHQMTGASTTMEHACFTLDGQVLSLNKRMRPSLIAYIQQTIKNNHETFRKEIDMATKTIFETKVGQVINELGELLKKKRPQASLDQGWRTKCSS